MRKRRAGHLGLAHDGDQRPRRARVHRLSHPALHHAQHRSGAARARCRARPGLLHDEYDVHTMVIGGFSDHPLITGFYLLGLFLLCLHLSHGFSSLLQTLGLNSKRTMAPLSRRRAGARLAHLRRVRLHPDRGLDSHPQNRASMIGQLDSKIPAGPLEKKWEEHQFQLEAHQSGQPAQVRDHRRRLRPGGRRGGGHARRARLQGEVLLFPGQRRAARTPSPRRAASMPRRITRTTATRCTASSTTRSRAATSARARRTSIGSRRSRVQIIDQCVAQGVPFAREYGGLLANRSFGGAQVSRTFYARGQTGQQLLLGAYSALSPADRRRQRGDVSAHARCSISWWWTATPRASSCATWSPATITSHAADCVVLATGGYGNVFYLSTNAKGCNATAIWRAYKKGALFANPCYTQIHPTCIPVAGEYQSKLTLMSESLRNDGRVWVPKKKGDTRPPREIPGGRARLLSRAQIPELRQPRAARHLLPRRQAGVRRRPRRRPRRARRLSRFRRCHPAPRQADGRGALRQSLRHVSQDHRRERLRDADADFPRRALHHGRPLGGL